MALGAFLVDAAALDVIVATVPALVAWQAQEFARRVLYTENRIRTAFAIDIVGFGGQVALILGLVAVDRISAAGALYAVAAASAAGALLGGWAIRHSLRGGVRRGSSRRTGPSASGWERRWPRPGFRFSSSCT